MTTTVRLAGRTRRRVSSLALGASRACTLGAPDPAPTQPAPGHGGPTISADKRPRRRRRSPPTWPLTGVAGEPVEPRPALAVKIENTSQARPQTGLDQADVVWETVVEFQVSRFVAVFHSQVPEEVGPIRSVRPMDPIILAPDARPAGVLRRAARGSCRSSQGLGHPAAEPRRRAPRACTARATARPRTTSTARSRRSGESREQDAPGRRRGSSSLFARTADAAPRPSPTGTPASHARRSASPLPSNPCWDVGRGSPARGSATRARRRRPRAAASSCRRSTSSSIIARHPDPGFNAQGGAPVPTYELVGSGKGFVATGGKSIAVTLEEGRRRTSRCGCSLPTASRRCWRPATRGSSSSPRARVAAPL